MGELPVLRENDRTYTRTVGKKDRASGYNALIRLLDT